MGLLVMKRRVLSVSTSAFFHCLEYILTPLLRHSSAFSRVSTAALISTSRGLRACFLLRSPSFLASSYRSFWMSSLLMMPMSRARSISPSVWTILSSWNPLTTCQIPSTYWMWDRNSLPSPAPSLAPLTKPAMSVIYITPGLTDSGWKALASVWNLSSGSLTMA